MFILTNESVVFQHGEAIELGRWENDATQDTYRITNGDNYQYAVVANFEVHEVDALPADYEANKYCYTEADGFTPNPDYVEPTEEDIKALEER